MTIHLFVILVLYYLRKNFLNLSAQLARVEPMAEHISGLNWIIHFAVLQRLSREFVISQILFMISQIELEMSLKRMN